MNETTRIRALASLMNCKPANRSRKYFSKVYVVKDSIFYTHNAAKRERNSLIRAFGRHVDIEEVTIEEAFESYNINLKANEHLVYRGDMEGDLFDGEFLID